MGKKIEGKFTWFENMSADPKKTAAFYTELFNWKTSEMPMEDGSKYTLFMNNERPVGGVVDADGGPSGWLSYVSVSDVDAAVAKTEAAGGEVKQAAFDVPGVGRMAIVSEPGGAPFALMDSIDDDFEGVRGAGEFHWNELIAQDPQPSTTFFEKALGYEVETMPMPNGDYQVLKSAGTGRAGILQAPSKDLPAHFLQYIEVDDCDATLKRAKKLGAKAMSEPVDVPGVGRFCVLEDPNGSFIGIIKPGS